MGAESGGEAGALGPEHALAAVMVMGLFVYLVSGGADFGGGVWDILAWGPRRAAQRALIERAIGPIWEANHVWFIFVFVLLFSAFPAAFTIMVSALFSPLTLYALGLVLRGSAFTFRHYAAAPAQRRTFGAVFSGASIVCPFLLGVMGAALLRPGPVTAEPDTLAVASGLFVLALLAAVAATYLTVEADGDRALQEDFRRGAAGALIVAGIASWIAFAAAKTQAIALPFGGGLVASVLGGSTLTAIAGRRFRVARVLVIALAAIVVAAWASAKGETLVWPLTLAQAKAHPNTLRFLLGACMAGFVLLAPSLVFLFRTFGRVR